MPDDIDGKPDLEEIDIGDINVDTKATTDVADDQNLDEAKSKSKDKSFDVGDGLG